MTNAPNPDADTAKARPGLRDRKKARRRQEILRAASDLFTRNGFDDTTLAEIAHDIGVSPPTISNYFGSKENILSALIFEGTERERTEHLKSPRRTGCTFACVLGDLLCEFTENTMKIAGKRVWRYAEARNIRRPKSDFEKQFAYSDAELRKLIAAFLSDYDIILRNGADPDPEFLGRMFFDRWTQHYFAYIKDDQMTVEAHEKAVRADVATMVWLLFDDGFAATSPLKKKAVAS